MKLLLFGSSGQLGTDCLRVFTEPFRVQAPDENALDLRQEGPVADVFSAFRPEVVVNCAAFTRVDDCETDTETAWEINAAVPDRLARLARRYGAWILHVSTDYVFDGEKTVPDAYREEDEPRPLSAYGRSKLDGEDAVRKACPDHAIVRTAWLYGDTGSNFLKTMLRLAVSDPERRLRVVEDQFGSPTWSHRLAQQLRQLVLKRGTGTYHATAEGYTNWFVLAKTFLERMGVPHRISPCPSKEYPTPAVRPKNSILENGRLIRQGIQCMRPWQEDLAAFVDAYGTRLLQEAKQEVA